MKSCYRSIAIRRPSRGGLSAIVAALLMVSAWLPGGAGAAWIDLGGQPLAVDLVADDGQRSVIEITLGGFAAETVIIEGETYYQITLAGEGRPLEAGLPDLPNVRRALIIPDDREMAVRVLEAEYVDVPDMAIAPSKGNLPRTVDPATVPYTFAPFYASDGVFPAEQVTADPPHIVRDYRGLVVDANVFQYLSATQTLRVATRLLIEIAPVGSGSVIWIPAPNRSMISGRNRVVPGPRIAKNTNTPTRSSRRRVRLRRSHSRRHRLIGSPRERHLPELAPAAPRTPPEHRYRPGFGPAVAPLVLDARFRG